MKKKRKKPRADPPAAEVADPKLVELYAKYVHTKGRDWHLHKSKFFRKCCEKRNLDPAKMTDHVVRMGDRQADTVLRESVRHWNLSDGRMYDRLPSFVNGGHCLLPGDVPWIRIEGWEEVQPFEVRKVRVAMTSDKWTTSDLISKKTKLPKAQVVKIVKKMVQEGRAEHRKKDDGTHQYRLVASPSQSAV